MYPHPRQANEVYFRVLPSVVEANKESTIEITSTDARFKFYDDITYEITFIPKCNSNVGPNIELSGGYFETQYKSHSVKPKNGVIKISYFFEGQQEWFIRISTQEYERYQDPMLNKWPGLKGYPSSGAVVAVYSLDSKLYGKIPLKGDLHVHATKSDGYQSPEIVVANYRKEGYDFVAITDHSAYTTKESIKESIGINEGIDILTGEEVHNVTGLFHMVKIGGDYCVSDLFANSEYLKEQVALAKKEYDVPNGIDENEYLHRVVLYKEIKKSGGIAIFPHPFWQQPLRFNSEEKMSMAVLQNKLCDVFEIIGGGSPENNNMQIALYNDYCKKGWYLPIVGSSDAHTTEDNDGATAYREQYTICFADSDRDVMAAILRGDSIAVESYLGEQPRVYGDYDTVSYAHFLKRCYFPKHDALCRAVGILLKEYINGDKSLKDAIIAIENKIKRFQCEFFGF